MPHHQHSKQYTYKNPISMRLNWYFKAKCKEFLRCMAKNASPKWKCTPKHTFDVNAEQTFNLQNKRNIFVRPNGKKNKFNLFRIASRPGFCRLIESHTLEIINWPFQQS